MKRKPTRGGSAVLGVPKANKPAPRTPRAPVIIALHPDGFVQVFGSRKLVDVKIVNHLDVHPEGEVLAERFAELSLPRRHRDVFLPVNLVAVGSARDCRTPDQEVERRYHLNIIRAVEVARKESISER